MFCVRTYCLGNGEIWYLSVGRVEMWRRWVCDRLQVTDTRLYWECELPLIIMTVYSVALLNCTVELHVYFVLFGSDVSLQLAQLSCVMRTFALQSHEKLELSSGDFLKRRRHVVLYQLLQVLRHLLPGATFSFRNHRQKYSGRQQGWNQGLLCFACHCAAL
jgi:hypothetical protein